MNAEQSYLSRLTFDPQLLKGWVASYLTNFRLTILLIIVVIGAGFIGYTELPRRLNPEVKIPIVIVNTVLPGASPNDVEKLVTIPLENAIQSVTGIDTMTSQSLENVSVVSIQFESTVDRDKARDDVQVAVDAVNDLPDDATTPSVQALDFENVPVWEFALTSQGDPASLTTFANRLQDALEDESTINTVSVRGAEESEFLVDVNPEKIRQYGISPLTLSQSVQAGLQSYPAGTVSTIRNSFALTLPAQIVTIDDIRNQRINVHGVSLRLSDIATVTERSKPNQRLAYLATPDNSTPTRAVTFSIFKTTAATITEAADQAEMVVEREMAPFSDSIQITTISNTAEEIDNQFSDLLGEFRTTIFLVFVCLFIFLGLRQAIISSVTVPLTFLSAFFFMNMVGMSINFLTLFAFLIALGLLIDDTIVVISAVTTYYRTGKFSPTETGLLVWRDTIVPIWSTTITTIWSFVPLLLATGIIGEFIKPIPVVITIVMVSSTAIAVLITLPIMMRIVAFEIPRRVVVFAKILGLLLAIGVFIYAFRAHPFLPLLIPYYVLIGFVFFRVRQTMMRIVTKRAHEYPRLLWVKHRLSSVSDKGIINLDGFAGWYERTITSILSRPLSRRLAIAGTIIYALVGFALVPLGFVENEFFPKTDAERLFVTIEYPAGTKRNVTEKTMLSLVPWAMQTVPEVEYVIAETSAGSPDVGNGPGSDSDNQARLTLVLPDLDERTRESFAIADALRASKPTANGATITVLEISGGPPAGADIQYSLTGEDLGQLGVYADQLMSYVANIQGVQNVEKSSKEGTSRIIFVPDQDALARYGSSVQDIGLWLRIYASGFSLGEVDVGGGEKQDIRFAMTQGTASLDDIGRLFVGTSRGNQVPLLELGHLALSQNPSSIRRDNGLRTITISASVGQGYSAVEKNVEVQKYVDSINFAPGYGYKTGGVNEENADAVTSIIQAMAVSALLILVTMVIQFGSFRQAGIVLIVIPLAVSSVFYVFGLFGIPLSFPALIGVLSLFGIVVTNSMFIVDKINLNLREGMRFTNAIADSGASRMEPIILTKLSTVLGLLPITLADPLWRGLGGAIIAGLLLASTIMLLFIPALYYEVMRTKKEDRLTTAIKRD